MEAPEHSQGGEQPSYDVNTPYGHTDYEDNWAMIQPHLEEKGYMLRPRYRPGWVGSWVGWRNKWKIPSWCEDSIGLENYETLMDAVRIEDGKQVVLKLWSPNEGIAEELPVLEYFSDPSRISDPHNHCVPLLDTIHLPGYADYFERILVEPMLRMLDKNPYLMEAELLSFILQLLEGVAYMHAHNVAHGDIHGGNIMVDPTLMFPHGFHGAYNLNRTHRVSEWWTKRLTRLQVPVRYYLIDFGSSAMFPSREERKPVPFTSAVWIPPEVQGDDPSKTYDAFKMDVYALGVVILAEIRCRHRRFWDMMPVFSTMISKNPEERPEVEEVLEKFKRFLRKRTPSQMRRRLGWDSLARVPLTKKLVCLAEYWRLLWHSYRYGLPKDLLTVQANI